MTTGAKDWLAACGFEVHYVVKENFAAVVENQPGVMSVFSFRSRAEAESRKALFRWVEEQNFDIIFDLQSSLRTFTWRYFLKQQSRLYVCPKPRWREFCLLILRLKSSGFRFGRGGRANLFLQFVQQKITKHRPALGLVRDSVQVPLTRLIVATPSEIRVEKNSIAVIPGSAWASKEWGAEKFAAFIEKQENPVVVLGGAKEKARYGRLIASATHPASQCLLGKTSLSDCIHILGQVNFVVGNDTGLLHIAEALGTKCIAIEGPTSEELGFSLYRPYNKIAQVPLFCRPCSKSGRVCWRWGSRECLRRVSVPMVESLCRQGKEAKS